MVLNDLNDGSLPQSLGFDRSMVTVGAVIPFGDRGQVILFDLILRDGDALPVQRANN